MPTFFIQDIYQRLLFFTLGSSISPQIYSASEVHAFFFEIDPDIIPRVTYHITWDPSWTCWFRITYLAVPGIIFSAYHTWSILPTIFIHEIYRRLLFFTLGRSVSAWKTSCDWFRITYLAVLGIHITSCEIDHEHHVVSYHIPGGSWYHF